MLASCRQMSEAEEKLFSGGTSPEPYMDLAGKRCAHAIRRFFPAPGRADVFSGKGNNGGDALVVARWLKRWGWEVAPHFSHGTNGLSPLAKRKWLEFREEPEAASPGQGNHRILVDGLLGIGATGDLRGAIRNEADRINQLRGEANAVTFAIDIPTGLDADSGEPGGGAVVADYTLSITIPKTGFAANASVCHLGRLVEIPLPIPVPDADDSIQFLFPSNLRSRLPRRPFDFHKGSAGRVVVVAGSRGMAGAGILASTGASHSGAGLTTLCVPDDIYPISASAAPAEVMVKPISSLREAASVHHDILAIGPGLGETWGDELVDLVFSHDRPMVVDADALNALSRSGRALSGLPAHRVLTPHPGELQRLVDGDDGFDGELPGERTECTRQLADRWGVTLLHKGARSAIATPGRPVELNTTGHPGMASGGMGDVLTGIVASLGAQELDLHDAGCVGSWLLGRAAEIVRDRSHVASESVTASQVASEVGSALRDLQIPPYAEEPVPATGTVASADSEAP